MNSRHTCNCLTFTLLVLLPTYFTARAQSNKGQTTEAFFKPIVAMESWAVYSMNAGSNLDRFDSQIRRLRLGASGQPYSWLNYHVQIQMDRLGEDSFAATKGSYSGIGIWDAFISARVLQNTDLIYVNAGYYWAAISREYNTSSWSLGSFDRSNANWYLRRFISGKGNGIESGIGLAGLKNYSNFGFSYRIACFEPAAHRSSAYNSHLYTAHLLFSLGDPEQKTYKYRLPGNHWQDRKGISFGMGAATQSKGQLSDATHFDQSIAYGADLLISYSGLRVDGEYFVMHRTLEDSDGYYGTEWHIRCGYTFKYNQIYIEPLLSYDKYEGHGNKSLYTYTGIDETLDFGINFYLNKDKMKLALHYIAQSGTVTPDSGNYLGLAFQFRL